MRHPAKIARPAKPSDAFIGPVAVVPAPQKYGRNNYPSHYSLRIPYYRRVAGAVYHCMTGLTVWSFIDLLHVLIDWLWEVMGCVPP